MLQVLLASSYRLHGASEIGHFASRELPRRIRLRCGLYPRLRMMAAYANKERCLYSPSSSPYLDHWAIGKPLGSSPDVARPVGVPSPAKTPDVGLTVFFCHRTHSSGDCKDGPSKFRGVFERLTSPVLCGGGVVANRPVSFAQPVGSGVRSGRHISGCPRPRLNRSVRRGPSLVALAGFRVPEGA